MNSLPHGRNLTSVHSNMCETMPISLFWAPNRLNELMQMFQIFPQPDWQIKIMGFLTGQLCCILKYCYTGGSTEQGFHCCFTDVLFHISSVPQSVQQANL